MREYPDVTLPEHFTWRKNADQALTWDLCYGPYEVATCRRDGIYWRARVAVLWADELQREEVAESLSQARYWCAKWAIREREKIRVTRPLSSGFSYGPDVFASRNAGQETPVATWSERDESARRHGHKRGRPGPRL